MLLNYDKEMPRDFYDYATELWIYDDGTIKTHSRKNNEIHDSVWGEEVYDNSIRGYYNHKDGIISVHGHVDQHVINKLARVFKDAMYIKQGW